MKKTTSNQAYFIALASAVFLSTTAIFIRYLTVNYTMPALVLAFWRDFFVVFLSYSSAAFTAMLGYLILKEGLGWIKITAVVCSLSGCVLVSGAYTQVAWQSNWIGILSGILAGLSYAVYSLMGRKANQEGMNSWTTILYTFAFAGLFLLIANLIPGSPIPGSASNAVDLFWLGNDWKGWLPLFLLAAGPTVMGFGLYNMSLRVLPASVANLIATSEPVFTAIFAYLIFGERLNAIELSGGFLIIVGVLLLRLSKNGKKDLSQA